MESIRSNVFETNSSSMHSLVINRHPNFVKNKNIVAKFMDFTSRTLIPHTDPEEKFSYLFMVFCSLIEFPMPYGKKVKMNLIKNIEEYSKLFDTADLSEDVSMVYKLPESYTDEEIDKLKARFEKLKTVFDLINDGLKDCKVSIDFSDVDLHINKENGYAYLSSKSEEYWGTGCYGNEVLESIFYMKSCAKEINNYLDDKTDINTVKYGNLNWAFMDMLEFAFDENSIFIQHTDEYDDEDMEQHKKLIVEYVTRCGGDATVDWPIGG